RSAAEPTGGAGRTWASWVSDMLFLRAIGPTAAAYNKSINGTSKDFSRCIRRQASQSGAGSRRPDKSHVIFSCAMGATAKESPPWQRHHVPCLLKGCRAMKTRALFVAGGLLAASLTPALADSVTAYVDAWDPGARTITLEDQSQIASIPATVTIPAGLEIGMQITVDYQGDENGIVSINSITINRNVAKRLPVRANRG